jgi:hypothetical protein
MAYGNWGAFVYKNGERQKNREDNTPYKEDEIEAGYWQAFAKCVDDDIGPCHASLGSGDFRLCGYKSYPRIYYKGEDVNYNEYYIGEYRKDSWFFDTDGIAGEIDGYRFKAWPSEEPEAVNMELIEPDGTKWTGKSGYGMGAGYE